MTGRIQPKEKIFACIPKTGGVSTSQIAKLLNRSPMTVWSNLMKLEEEGRIEKIANDNSLGHNRYHWVRTKVAQ